MRILKEIKMAKIKVELEMEEAEYALIWASVTLAVVVLSGLYSTVGDYHDCFVAIRQAGKNVNPHSLENNLKPLDDVAMQYMKSLIKKE